MGIHRVPGRSQRRWRDTVILSVAVAFAVGFIPAIFLAWRSPGHHWSVGLHSSDARRDLHHSFVNGFEPAAACGPNTSVDSGGGGGNGSSSGGSGVPGALSALMNIPMEPWTQGWLQQRAQSLPCVQSGYCSVNLTQPWSGDISSKAGLLAAVRARGFVHGAGERPELITTLGSTGSLPASVNLHLSFRKLGLDNVLFLADTPETCELYMRALPDAGCGWYSTDPHTGLDLASNLAGHHQSRRWWTMARLVRQGVNVLHTDSDVHAMMDPYLFLKRGPFASKQLMTQHERPWADSVNCGMSYVQNAARDGAAAWILTEIVDRSVRVWENLAGVQENFPILDVGGFTWEQSTWNDVLRSAIIGQPVFEDAMFNDARGSGNATAMKEWGHRAAAFSQHFKWTDMPRVQQDWPPEWWQFTQTQRSDMVTASIRVPHTRGQWPPELGGRILPLKRGAHSKALLQQLRDEAAVPLWPDPEDLATVAASDAQLPEAFSYMPLWIGSSWAERGEFGWWSTRPPHVVLGHVVTLNYHSIFKDYIWKALQHWNWEAEELLDPEGLQRFPSSTPEQRLPRLVALPPDLKPLTETEEELRMLHVRLAQVAAVADRKFTWSLPDCNSAWIKGPELNHSDPEHPPMQVPSTIVVPFTEPGAPMQCMWFRPIDPHCLKTGMVYPEFKRMLELLRSNASSTAAVSSTLFLNASSEIQPQGRLPVLEMSQAELQRQLAPHQGSHVIYLAADVHITDLDAALQAKVTRSCKYMKDLDEDFQWG